MTLVSSSNWFPRHRLKFEFHAKQANGSEFSVEMLLGFEVIILLHCKLRGANVRDNLDS